MSSARCILMYHSVDASRSPVSVTPEEFARHMSSLKESGARVAPLERVAAGDGDVALTFDDAFGNLTEHALPLLEQYGFPATLFAVSGYTGKRNNWPTQPAGIAPELELMDWSELRAARKAGFEIGGHTVTHPDLRQLSSEAAAREIVDGKHALEDGIGEAITSFAYPYGRSNAAARQVVSTCFFRAVGTRLRPLGPGDDVMELPRIDSYYVRDPFWFDRLRTPLGGGYLRLRRVARELRSAD